MNLGSQQAIISPLTQSHCARETKTKTVSTKLRDYGFVEQSKQNSRSIAYVSKLCYSWDLRITFKSVCCFLFSRSCIRRRLRNIMQIQLIWARVFACFGKLCHSSDRSVSHAQVELARKSIFFLRNLESLPYDY